ncbi:unnamed protein product [Boreogadus saida]
MEPAVPCGAGPLGGALGALAAPPRGKTTAGGPRRRRPSEIRQKLAAGGWVSGYATRCVASSSLLEQLHFLPVSMSISRIVPEATGRPAELSVSTRAPVPSPPPK